MLDSPSSKEKISLLKKISDSAKESAETATTDPKRNSVSVEEQDASASKRPDFRKLKSIVKEKIMIKEPKEEKKEKEENDDEGEVLDLEFDSYVYLGVVLPDFILIFYKVMSAMFSQMIMKDRSMFYSITHSFKFVFTRMAKVWLFFVLLIPGLLVPFIQIVVIGSFDKGELDLDLIDYNKKLLSVAKIFMIFMFSCMALKECSNALKNWLHTIYYMKRLEKVVLNVKILFLFNFRSHLFSKSARKKNSTLALK